MTYTHYVTRLWLFTFLFCLVMLNTDDSFNSEGKKEDTSTHTCHPHLQACGMESSISHGVKTRQRVYSVEKCSEESGGPTLSGQSSSAREGRQRHMLMDSDEKPKISCRCGKATGNVIVHQCSNTVHEMTPSHKRNMKSLQRAHAGDVCCTQDQSLDVKQSTSVTTEAELHETKRSAPCQTVCKILYFINCFSNHIVVVSYYQHHLKDWKLKFLAYLLVYAFL